MNDQMQFVPVSNYWEGLGHERVVATAAFTYGERLWEYYVLTSPEYTYELALVDLTTESVYGPYEYVLPEYNLGELMAAVRQFAQQVLDQQHG